MAYGWALRCEENTLSHHGIEGQKWGVRNGPPYPLTSDALASKIYRDANRRIVKISSDVIACAKGSKSRPYGLEHQLKTKESIKRKIETDAEEKGLSLGEAANKIRDVIRFTTISDANNFVSNYEKFKDLMANKGYSEVKCKNYWVLFNEGKAKHKSVTSNFQTRDGYIFEVQFQTPTSQSVKDRKVPLYEEVRNPRTSATRKREIEAEMERMASEIEDPVNISRIKNHG